MHPDRTLHIIVRATLVPLVFALTAACGATFPSSLPGPLSGKPCPKGSVLRGEAPPDGKRMWCETPVPGSDKAEKTGPVVNWACFGCEDGAALHGRYVKGRRHGLWTLYKPDGGTLERGSWKDGKRVGVWQGWHPNGKERFRVIYGVEGRLNGPATYGHKTGARKAEGMYRGGDKTGIWRTWHANGKRESQGNYKRGHRDSTWTWYGERGRLVRRVNYVDGQARHERELVVGGVRHTVRCARGFKKRSWTERAGKKHGQTVRFYPNSKRVRCKESWRDGVAHGTWVFHRRDGTRVAAGPVADGRKACGWRYFAKDGRDITRRAAYAKVITKRAVALSVALPTAECKWSLDALLPLLRARDRIAAVATARWLIERELDRSMRDRLTAEQPGARARHGAAVDLASKADMAFAAGELERSALMHVAAFLEADRALGGTLLGPDSPKPVVPPKSIHRPAADLVAAEHFRTLAIGELASINDLLMLRGKLDRTTRKNARVILSFGGLNRFSVKRLTRQLQ